MSAWTEGDTRAEIARVVERAKEVVVPLEAAGKAIRQIGESHEHPKLAEDGIERLREAVSAAGIIVPDPNAPVEAALRRALAVSHKRIDELNAQLVAQHIAKPQAFGATVKAPNDGAPEWWDRLSEFARTAAAGHVLAFERAQRDDMQIVLRACPYTQIEPAFLVLDPRLPEGEVTALEIMRCNKFLPGPARISAFQSRGVAPEVFFANRLQTHRMTPAHRATLILRFDEPYHGPVHAFMWGRAYDFEGELIGV